MNTLWLTALVLLLAGCSSTIAPTPEGQPPPSHWRPDVALPGPTELVPDGLAGGTAWGPFEELPPRFEGDASFATTGEIANAYRASILSRWADGGVRPDLALDTLDASEDAVVLLISETGAGDDSVAGEQHALFLRRGPAGWRLERIWSRMLCARGVDGELCT